MLRFEVFSLLQRGYFPKELPFCFNTFSFALQAKEMLTTNFRGVNNTFKPELLSIPRGETARRDLALLNPCGFFKLVKCLFDNETSINSYFPSSPYSLSFPTNTESLADRALMPSSSSVMFYQQEMLKRSIGKNVILKLDVNNFYSSVYTHAIEWAMVGKDDAKKVWAGEIKIGTSFDGYKVGKALDEMVMHNQDEETHGIPVGTDVSFLIGELLLCRVDSEIKSCYPQIKGCRFYDDYTFFLDDERQAKEVLKSIQSIMHRYGLDVNERKVEIKTVPCSMVDNSMKELLPYKGLVSIVNSTLIGYFDTVWYLAEQNPSKKSTVFRYALKTLLSKCFSSVWDPSNKELFHTLLLKTISIDPTIIPVVYQLFQVKKDRFTDLLSVANCLNGILVEMTKLQHHIEIAWALWMVNKYTIPIEKNILLSILDLNNSICSLQVMAYLDNSAFKGLKKDTEILNKLASIESTFSDATLNSSQWLMLYESTVKGWLNGMKWINRNSFFKFLYDRKVSFYDPNNAADFSSDSYLKKYLFTNVHVPKIENEALRKADEIWERLKINFYKENELSLDEDDYNRKVDENMPEEDVIADIFSKIMLREAHLTEESLEELETMLQKQLHSCFRYFCK